MKKTLIASGLVALMATSAAAQEIGATFSRFDDNWLTVLRTGMVEYAGTIDGLAYQQEDATDDLAKQIDQVKNFVASGVDAIIVNIVDTSAGAAVSAAAGDTPLVYVNREPDNLTFYLQRKHLLHLTRLSLAHYQHLKFVKICGLTVKLVVQLVI